MSDNSPVVFIDVPPKRLPIPAVIAWQQLLVCPLVLLAIYLIFPTRDYYWDGITFSATIEASQHLNFGLIHPHHLLYNVFGFAVYRLANLVGWHPRAVTVLTFTNSCLSVVCTIVLFRFLVRIVKSINLSLALSAAFAFSAVWWKYSVDANAYIPAILLLTWSLVVLFREQIAPVRLAMIHTAAMCMHQLAVFVYPALVVGILLDASISRRERFKVVAQYTLTAVYATVAINYLCFNGQTGSFGLREFAKWLTAYLQGAEAYSFSFTFTQNFALTLTGLIKLFFAGRIAYLNGITSKPIVFLLVLLLALIVTIIWRVAGALLRRRFPLFCKTRIKTEHKRLAIVCCVWISTYVVFLFFWYPYFTPYRAFYLPPLICLVGILLASISSNTSPKWTTLAFCVAAMALSNFVFNIFPQSQTAKNPPLQFALDLNNVWNGNTHVLYAKSNADNQLVRYFNPSSKWRQVNSRDLVLDLNSKVEELHNDKQAAIWLDLTAVDGLRTSLQGQDWLNAHTTNDCKVELSLRGYHLKFVRVLPDALAREHIGGCD